MVPKFAVGSLVRNKKTNEDGKVIEIREEKGIVLYQVSVPIDATSWMLGAVEARWPESDLVLSTNEHLR